MGSTVGERTYECKCRWEGHWNGADLGGILRPGERLADSTVSMLSRRLFKNLHAGIAVGKPEIKDLLGGYGLELTRDEGGGVGGPCPSWLSSTATLTSQVGSVSLAVSPLP
jgi:hypothetical protein